MPLQIIIILLAIFSALSLYGQTKSKLCNCPITEYAGTKADTTYYLSNNKTIVLCGFKNTDINPPTFSEFVLAVCGEDTIIDFWDATVICNLIVNKDTIFINELKNLPTGKNFKFQPTIWTTEKIYFIGKKIARNQKVNKKIPKYSRAETDAVLKAYETSKPNLDERKMDIGYKLFLATISGDKKARQYFTTFNNKFHTLDGAYLEEYEDLHSMLELWDGILHKK